MSTQLHQRVAVDGGYEFLAALESLSSRTWLPEDELLTMLEDAGAADPRSTLIDFVEANLLASVADGLGITSLGIRTALLLDAMNGATDLRSIFSRLSVYDASLRMYQLIREGMSKAFIDTLRHRRGFRRLYLCSPWISFHEREILALTRAIVDMQTRGEPPEIFVLTRPIEGDRRRPPAAVAPLQELGATVFLNPRLHTKLYIREPDLSGGYSLAIVGSENLTRSRHLELGIRINGDTQMISQLVAYFWDITNVSIEV